MKAKKLAEDYLSFTKNDRMGLIVLLFIISIIAFLPKWFPKPQAENPIIDTTLLSALNTQQSVGNSDLKENEDVAIAPAKSYKPEGALFVFDPNTLPTKGWQKLGLNERVIKTINNYRNKGGRFYKKEDLKKIWGLPEAFYNRVEPYITIELAKNYTHFTPYQKREKKIAIVEINTADTSAFIALPGIGSKLSARIVNFRERLGGFYSVDQIAETWGLSDSTFQLIKPYLQAKEGFTKRLNINQASKDDLKVHPYIKWKLASAIVDYRIRHGLYNSLAELKNIPDIDDATFEKIRHYLTL